MLLNKKYIKSLILISSVFIATNINMAETSAQENTQIPETVYLKDIKIKKTIWNTLELKLTTSKKIDNPQILTKNKNMHVISLPGILYDGQQKLDVSRYKSTISGVSVDFVKYEKATNRGYTRILVQTKKPLNFSVKTNYVLTKKEKIKTITSIVALMLLLSGCISLSQYYYIQRKKEEEQKQNNNEKDKKTENFENFIPDVVPENLEEILESKIENKEEMSDFNDIPIEEEVTDTENITEEEIIQKEEKEDEISDAALDEFINSIDDVDNQEEVTDTENITEEETTQQEEKEDEISDAALDEFINSIDDADNQEEVTDTENITEEEIIQQKEKEDEIANYDENKIENKSNAIVFQTDAIDFTATENKIDENEDIPEIKTDNIEGLDCILADIPDLNEITSNNDIDIALIETQDVNNLIKENDEEKVLELENQNINENVIEEKEEIPTQVTSVKDVLSEQEMKNTEEKEVLTNTPQIQNKERTKNDVIINTFNFYETQKNIYDEDYYIEDEKRENKYESEVSKETIFEEFNDYKNDEKASTLESPFKEDDNIEPVVIEERNIDKNKQLYLIKHEGEYSIVGTISENVFVLNKFMEPPEKTKILLKFNEKKDNKDIYIVKIDRWRALISVTDNSMENILTLS